MNFIFKNVFASYANRGFSKITFKNNFCVKAKMNKINVNGNNINYIKVGSGEKTILCFPGALGTIWSDFKPQIEKLDHKLFTIVAFDPPGYGQSQPPLRQFGVNFYHNDADFAQKFMKVLGIQQYSLLGWSDGGISSMILAAKYPNNVDKLVIWGSSSFVMKEEIEIYESIRDTKKWSEKMRTPLIETYGEEYFQKMWSDWCDALSEIYKSNNGNICDELLSSIKCSTLVLHGEKDPLVLSEHPGHLIRNIKTAKLHTFPNGKHNIHLRYSDEFNKIVTDFLLKE